MSYTCPKCGATSYNPNDEFYGYCGNCHQFTRGVRYGDQRHRSSSFTAGQEREMRMQPDNEEPEAQPEVSQVQGEGNSGSLRDVRRQRMEPQDESLMQLLQRERLPDAADPKPLESTPEYPSRFRFYSGALGLGAAMGISWTAFALGPFVLRYITRGHALIILYGMVAALFAAQTWMLYRWHKQLKERRAKLEKFWDQYFEPGKNPFKGKI
jgi:hypothetical protein